MKYKTGSILKRKIYAVYSHMGIYDGRKVFHYHKQGKNFSIIYTSLKEFGDEKDVAVHLEPENSEHARDIIKRAMEAYRNGKWTNRYSLVLRNCEDFCAYCYGRGRYGRLSQRGKTALTLMAITTIIAAKKI